MTSNTTVPAAAASVAVSHDLMQQMKQSLQTMNVQRLSLEQEADAITWELTNRDNGQAGGEEPMGIDTPLVDAEGFPRGDIDIYRARALRKRLNEIRTDHAALMKSIEQTMHQLASMHDPEKSKQEKEELMLRSQPKPKPKYDPVTGKWVVMNWDGTVAGVPGGERRNFHNLNDNNNTAQSASSSANAQVSSTTATGSTTATSTALFSSSRPFARVDSVAPQSPAQLAGLQVDDLIVAFGDIRLDSTDNPMTAIGELVPRAAGMQSTVEIVVQRRGSADAPELKTVTLQPQPWLGRGLLGCHILPFNAAAATSSSSIAAD